MTRFTEVADRVWVAHYDWMHVNITLVGGDAGLLMVDTHGSERMARTVADDVRRLGAGDGLRKPGDDLPLTTTLDSPLPGPIPRREPRVFRCCLHFSGAGRFQAACHRESP